MGNAMRQIDCQDANRCPADWRFPDQNCSIPFKVIFPAVAAGMKQPCDPPREGIAASEVRPFMMVAGKTGQRKIRENRSTAVLARIDMVHLKRQRIERLRHATILAPACGSTAHLSPQGGTHRREVRAFAFSDARVFDFSTPKRLPIRSYALANSSSASLSFPCRALTDNCFIRLRSAAEKSISNSAAAAARDDGVGSNIREIISDSTAIGDWGGRAIMILFYPGNASFRTTRGSAPLR